LKGKPLTYDPTALENAIKAYLAAFVASAAVKSSFKITPAAAPAPTATVTPSK
jgi:hypothetical protein